jgi:hypothetical protein
MFAFLAPAALKLGAKMLFGRVAANAKADIAAIPPKVKLAIAGVLLLVALFFVHQHIAHKHLKAADKAGYDRAKAEDAAQLAAAHRQALEARARAEAIGAEISRNTREKNDEEARNIARSARDVLVRGPGEARCRPVDHSGVPAGGGGYGAAGGQPDAAGPQVPADELAAVPWPWLVGRAEQADLNRSEVLTWREWYDRQFKAWEQMRSSSSAKAAADGR